MKSVGLVLMGLLVSTRIFAGVFETDEKKAFATALKTKKPLIISFYGIWCPPCNELKETVFETPQFLAKAKRFSLLNIDADASSSWAIKDRYKVGGYPTIVFTNSEGGEIYRVVGYRSLTEFLRVMDVVLAAGRTDLASACKRKDTNSLWRCAVVCSEKKDKACATAAYQRLEKRLKPGSARYDLARTYFAENAETPDLKRDQYERLLRDYSGSPQALYWATSYYATLEEGKGPAPKTELVENVLKNYKKFTSDPRADELGISLTDMAQLRAELLDKLGKKEESKSAWQEAGELLSLAAKALPAGSPARGYTIEQIGSLENGGNLEAALKLANEFRIRYPQEFTFHFMAAGILERQKRYNDALPVALRAYESSYGDNRIRSATLLMKLYATVPDKTSGKKILEEIHAEFKPEDNLEVRTHRYLKRLGEAATWL